jgi:hypothetical protein
VLLAAGLRLRERDEADGDPQDPESREAAGEAEPIEHGRGGEAEREGRPLDDGDAPAGLAAKVLHVRQLVGEDRGGLLGRERGEQGAAHDHPLENRCDLR